MAGGVEEQGQGGGVQELPLVPPGREEGYGERNICQLGEVTAPTRLWSVVIYVI